MARKVLSVHSLIGRSRRSDYNADSPEMDGTLHMYKLAVSTGPSAHHGSVASPTNVQTPTFNYFLGEEMQSTLGGMSFSQIQVATAMAVGRSPLNADSLEMTDFGDCVRNDFWWSDGACWSMMHDTKEEAMAEARDCGFAA